MGRALVVGCGYVGTSLAHSLVRNGWDVWGLRRRAERLPDPIRAVRADVSRPESLREGGLPLGLDLVVYAVSADESTESAYRTAYVGGLRNVLECLADGGGGPERLIFVSSTAVYGQEGGEWVDEDAPTEPAGFRGRILLEAESVAREWNGRATVLRLGGIYGPGRTRLVDRVRSGEARCPSNPPRYANRIHRDDAAGILRHVAKLKEPDPIYLGVDTEPAPICRVLRWLARRTGSPEPLRAEPGEGSRRRRTNKRCSSERVRDAGYTFLHPTFREGYGELLS